MFLTVIGILVFLAGVGFHFYGKYLSHNVLFLLDALLQHGIIDPGAIWKSVGNFLIVIGVVLIIFGIRSRGAISARKIVDDEFDVDDADDEIDVADDFD